MWLGSKPRCFLFFLFISSPKYGSKNPKRFQSCTLLIITVVLQNWIVLQVCLLEAGGMASQLVREWMGIQQFPVATQTALHRLLGKLKQEV
jgi:hypothetical protein